MAESNSRPAQALVRWDPFGFATEELNERAAAGFPPALRLATVDRAVDRGRRTARPGGPPPGTQVLGPVTVPGAEPPAVRALLRVPRPQGVGLAAALRRPPGCAAPKRLPGAVRIQIDPVAIGSGPHAGQR